MTARHVLGCVLCLCLAPVAAQTPDYRAQLQELEDRLRERPSKEQLYHYEAVFQAAVAIHELGEDEQAARWARRIYTDGRPAGQALEALLGVMAGDVAKHGDLAVLTTANWPKLLVQLRDLAQRAGERGAAYRTAEIVIRALRLVIPSDVDAWAEAPPELRRKLLALVAADPRYESVGLGLRAALDIRLEHGSLTEPSLIDILIGYGTSWDERLQLLSRARYMIRNGEFLKRFLPVLEAQALAEKREVPPEALHNLVISGLIEEAAAFVHRREVTLDPVARRKFRWHLYAACLHRDRQSKGQSQLYAQEVAYRRAKLAEGGVDAWLALADLLMSAPDGISYAKGPNAEAGKAYRKVVELTPDALALSPLWMWLFRADAHEGWAAVDERIGRGTLPLEARLQAAAAAYSATGDPTASLARVAAAQPAEDRRHQAVLAALLVLAGESEQAQALLRRCTDPLAVTAVLNLPRGALLGDDPCHLGRVGLRPKWAPDRHPWRVAIGTAAQMVPRMANRDEVCALVQAALFCLPHGFDGQDAVARDRLVAAVRAWLEAHPAVEAKPWFAALTECLPRGAYPEMFHPVRADRAPAVTVLLETAIERGRAQGLSAAELDLLAKECRARLNMR
jgi:hypothetical protein